MWVQEDSGAVMDFRGDGKIIGWPVGGTFSFPEPEWIEIKSGPETLRCRWKKLTDNALGLARFIEGKPDTIVLEKLSPAPLDLKKWKGRYVIRHMLARGKRASERSVTLEESGHFRMAIWRPTAAQRAGRASASSRVGWRVSPAESGVPPDSLGVSPHWCPTHPGDETGETP